MPSIAYAESFVRSDAPESDSASPSGEQPLPSMDAHWEKLAALTNVALVSPAEAPTALRLADDQATTAAAFAPAVPQPVARPFKLLQQWEGVVTAEPSEAEFIAILHDRTAPSLPEEQATFSLDDVAPADRRLVIPGAVFYWSIGYEDTPAGTRRTVSLLRFRRLPAWSRGDLRRIRDDVQRYKRLFAQTE